MKANKPVLIAAALALVAAVALSLLLLTPPAEQPVEPEVAAPAAPPAPAAAKPLPPPTRPTPLLPQEDLPAEILAENAEEHGEFTTSTDLMKRRVLKSEPKLEQFAFFREHVLMDSANRKDFEKLLADRALYDKVRKDLLYPEGTKDTMEANVKRLVEIDYLRDALSWKDNPERKGLVATVEGIILEDSFGADMPADIKRSVAASKFELFEILSESDPERARQLVESARGTRLEKLINYFAESNERRLAKERELSLQGQKQAQKP